MTGLYAVKLNGSLKIGYSLKIKQRILQLCAESRVKSATVIGVLPCHVTELRATERKILDVMKPYRIYGERHVISAASLEAVRSLSFQPCELTKIKIGPDPRMPWMRVSPVATANLHIKLTAPEKRQIETFAASRRMTLSAFARQALFAYGEQ